MNFLILLRIFFIFAVWDKNLSGIILRTLFMTFMWACPCAHTFGPYFSTASESGLKTDLGVVVVVILLLVIKFLSNWTAFVNFNVINIFRKI